MSCLNGSPHNSLDVVEAWAFGGFLGIWFSVVMHLTLWLWP